jgi:hypothetical protein
MKTRNEILNIAMCVIYAAFVVAVVIISII